jgi:hypothetical protein
MPAPHDAGGAHADAGWDAGADDDDAGKALRPLLAASGAQLLVQGQRLGLQLTAANLADDADVYAVHQEFYGIPWAAFEQDSAPPAEWRALLDELAAAAKTKQRPVFLSISMLNGARERLAATTRIEDGQVKTDDDSSAPCYDFATASDSATKQQAYLRYVDYMVDHFDPKYLNIAIEVNLFFEKCPTATAGLITVINAVYDHVKAQHPDVVVFPSFQIDHLYGYSDDTCPGTMSRAACFERAYTQIKGIRRDRFAMSSYPFLNKLGTAATIPADWFERGAKRAGERPLIAETGWPSTPLVARNGSACLTVFSFSEADSAAYLKRVLEDATRLHMDLVTWWSDRDLVTTPLMTDCPCQFDQTWCTVLDIFRGAEQPNMPEAQFYGEVLLKAFGSMGLRKYDGTPKTEHMKLWNDAKN